MKRAFTLIELLIVVAIIAILAAIAVPNFLEAQIRAKVGRTKADLRTLATAMEAYSIDYNGRYPILNGYAGTSYTNNIDRGGVFLAWGLTTPVAYLTSVAMADPFVKTKGYDTFGQIANTGVPGSGGARSFTYHYVNCPQTRETYAKLLPYKDGRPLFFLFSFGPDYISGPMSPTVVAASYGASNQSVMSVYLATYATAKPTFDNLDLRFSAFQYDPSNGTISGGDVIRPQG